MDRQTQPCRHTQADTPPSHPCHCGLTGGKDVDYTHFSSSPLFFLPPLTKHPSLSISIMMAAFHQLALLYPLPLPLLAAPYFFTLHSLLCVLSHHASSPGWPSASTLIFISLEDFTLERDIQQVAYCKKSKGENTVLFLFLSQLSSLFIVYNSNLTRLLSLITLFFTLMLVLR